MKKNVFGRKFKRDTNERKALFKNLLTSLVLEERIKTTEAKAKAIKGKADKLVTKAKKGGVNVYKSIHPDVNHLAAVKLLEDIGPRFEKRQGGYTRIVKIGKRRVADNAPMVVLEWTEQGSKLPPEARLAKGGKAQSSQKKAKKAKKVKKDTKTTQVVKAQEIKKQPKIREVIRKQVTRQKKGQ